MNDDDDFEIQEISASTPNFRTELAGQLADLVPEAVADGKIDVIKLKELLDDDVSDESERFGLFWPGKRRAMRAAQEPTTATLRPDFENSNDWDTTQNVFIEGDNLEVLKLLQRHYHGKVKMIYIDPPYNTGKDFVYPDNFKEGLESYLEWTKQVNEDGKKVATNAETEGRYHSNWLNMMYPRLKLARNLLTDDGVMFLSIDDREVARLIAVACEIFGESNFVCQFVWKKGGTGKIDSRFAVVEHEYVLAFARDASKLSFRADEDGTTSTSYSEEDENGKYSLVRLDQQSLQYSSSLDYVLVGPDGSSYRLEHKNPAKPNAIWRWSKERVERDIESLVFRDGKVYTKNYRRDGAKVRSLLAGDRFGVTRTGRADAEDSLGTSGVFEFPKPLGLLQFLIQIGTDPDSIVLDFFAGSGSTAHAVMRQNLKDGGRRRFIQVQLPFPLEDTATGRDLGCDTVAAIARKRIEGAGRVLLKNTDQRVDVGFRTYSLAKSNFTKWALASVDNAPDVEKALFALRSGSSEDLAVADDLMAELLLKLGYSLTESIERVDVAGLDLRSVGDGALIAYLNEHVKPSLDQLRAVIELNPASLIILEDAFDGDDELKANLVQMCRSKARGTDDDGIKLWTA
jgi:adenine-specific DNA-methyltransferase